jgi:hypothetical protein
VLPELSQSVCISTSPQSFFTGCSYGENAVNCNCETVEAKRRRSDIDADVIARNLAATAIQAQWRKWSAARLLKREIRNAVVFARQHWKKKEIDHVSYRTQHVNTPHTTERPRRTDPAVASS